MKVCSVCQRCFEDSALSCSEAHHEPLTEGRAGNCEIIAGYRLEFLLESFRAGETYRAVNTILKKPCLIKILAPELFAAEQKSRESFLREARDLSAIIHPNIARVYESGALSDGSVYVVTEFFTAQTLRDCLTSVGSSSEVTALTIARQAAEGLEALHAVGVLHKNICPENIILTSDAENRFLVKLQNIDFGGIRQTIVNSNGDQNLSNLKYFSPEQCTAQTIDAQTDVYSLGVVLYESLTGQPPFEAPDAVGLIDKQINEPPPPVEIHSFDIRALLTHTLMDSLQKTKRLRLKTANAFARRLRHVEQLATHSPTPPPAIAYPAAMNKAARLATPPKIKNSIPVENQKVIENLTLVENHPMAEKSELPVKAFDDFTTTKLPPIESIIENHFSENERNAQTTAVFYETAENSEIHVTNEALLIEWEQPDDIPSKPEIFQKAKKETGHKEPVFIDDDDSIIDAGEVDAPFDAVSEVNEIGRHYTAPRPVFSSSDSAKSWSLPDRRKLLTGAGLAALFVLAVGGTLLSRQFQLARDARQTTTQSSPNSKSLPKPAEPDQVSENDKSLAAKPAPVTLNKQASNADDSDTLDMSDTELRDIDEKNVVPISQSRNKKRVFKESSENRSNAIQTKLVSNESSNKKAELKSSPDKKSAVKSQVSTSPKPDIFTRPRIVKNPKF